MPRTRASDAADALVGDLTSFTSKQIASGLENVNVSFTCKVCHMKENTLQDLLVHLNSSKCSRQSAADTPSSTGQRPRRGQRSLEDASQAGCGQRASRSATSPRVTVSTTKKTTSRTPVSKVTKNPADPVQSPRRVTRISSGSIKRKTAAEILGMHIKEEPLSDDTQSEDGERTDTKPPLSQKRGRGRPRKAIKEEPDSEYDSPVETPKRFQKETNVSCQATLVTNPTQLRGRGRPRKIQETTPVEKTIKLSSHTKEGDTKEGEADDGVEHNEKEKTAQVIKYEAKDSANDPKFTSDLPFSPQYLGQRPKRKLDSVADYDAEGHCVKAGKFDSSAICIAPKPQAITISTRLVPRITMRSSPTILRRPLKTPVSRANALPVINIKTPPKIVFMNKSDRAHMEKSPMVQMTGGEMTLPQTDSDQQMSSPIKLEAVEQQLSSPINLEASDHQTSSPIKLEVDEDQITEEEPGSPQPELDPETGFLYTEDGETGTLKYIIPEPGFGAVNVQPMGTEQFVAEGETETGMGDTVEGETIQHIQMVDTDMERVRVEAVDTTDLQELTDVPEDMLVALAEAEPPTEVPASTEQLEQIPPIVQRAKWKHERKYRCVHCKSRGFSNEEHCQLHVQCHVDPTLGQGYQCPTCELPMPTWTRMLYHLLTHDDYRKMLEGSDMMKNMLGEFKCPICSKVFTKKVNFTCHYRKIHFRKSRVCDICGESVTGSDIKTFHRHVEKCKNITKSCPHCEYTTTVAQNMKMHMNTHSGTGFQCTVCQRICGSKARLRIHERTHDPNRQLVVCDQCGKGFKTKDAVKKHIMRFHTEVSHMYECGLCGYTTRMELDLKKHVKCVHNKKYRCEHCRFQTNQESSFRSHMAFHLPDRIHPCPYSVCFYRACTTKQLTDHLAQVHNIKSKHQCPLCYKYYKKRTHLLRHLVSHTGEKAYHCRECGMEFVSHSSYYRHRNKTGHDAKREGVVSVPQNITIQYVEEGSEEAMEAGTAGDHSDGQVQVDSGWQMTEVSHIPEDITHIMSHNNNIQHEDDVDSQQEGATATDIITQVMNQSDEDNNIHIIHNQQLQQQHTEQQVIEESICITPMPNISEEDGTINVQPSIQVTVEEMSGEQKPIIVPTTYIGEDGTETIHTLQIPENMRGADDADDNSPQVIYVVKSEDGSMMASTEQLNVPLEQPCIETVDDAVQQEHEMTLEELISGSHQVVMQDDGGMAFIEVAGETVELAQEQEQEQGQGEDIEAGGGGEYAVVIKEVQVPEAALSMLQLQSGQQ